MDAVEFFEERDRMCRFLRLECKKCGIDALGRDSVGCFGAIRKYPAEAVEIVERWAKEHPKKTRQSKLLKLFPRAEKGADGIVQFCPQELDSSLPCPQCQLGRSNCDDCRKKYWLSEVEDESRAD
jgi:hypothetical protein